MFMYYLDNVQRSYKPQTKHTERMILPSSSQNACKCTFECTKLIELLHTQNDFGFVAIPPFSPVICKLARVAVLTSCGSVKF